METEDDIAVCNHQGAVLDLGFDQGGGIPHQAEKGGGIWQLGGGVF